MKEVMLQPTCSRHGPIGTALPPAPQDVALVLVGDQHVHCPAVAAVPQHQGGRVARRLRLIRLRQVSGYCSLHHHRCFSRTELFQAPVR